MNQNSEQLARDRIDEQLTACGWTIQNKSSINLHAGIGIAVREYSTDVGPADYVLFVDKRPVGIIEAKRAEEGVHLTVHEEQSQAYAESKLKYLNNDPLPFVYESTGEVTRFTGYRDPKPRSRNVFTFHHPSILRGYLKNKLQFKKSTNTNRYDKNCSHSRSTFWPRTWQIPYFERQVKTGALTWTPTYCSKS